MPRATQRRPTQQAPLPDALSSSTNDLKQVFRETRNFLAGNAQGITRDETIAQNMIRLLFCKLHDERRAGERMFYHSSSESAEQLTRRIRDLFEEVKSVNGSSFSSDEEIELTPDVIANLVENIQDYSLSDADRDTIGDAFEELISTSFRGGMGQFFTPRNVVEMMISIIQPRAGERILDPACGSGGFLSSCLRHFARNQISDFEVVGIEKDFFLAKLAKAYCRILAERNTGVFNENSLVSPNQWQPLTQANAELGSFDVVLTNPPFGAKIPITGKPVLSQYDLGRKWQRGDAGWQLSDSLHDKQPPQILFIERCLQFLKTGGRMGIILPDGIFGNPSERYIWEYIDAHASVFGVISLAPEAFQPSTHTKTSVLLLEKVQNAKKAAVFMSVARSVGHDKNGKTAYKITPGGKVLRDELGRPLIDDDLPHIAKRFHGDRNSYDRWGFWVDSIENHIYIPEYYNPHVQSEINTLKASGGFDLLTLGELLERKHIEITRGNEVGSKFYGAGNIPFVRTTDIVNWEIKMDTVKKVSEEVYNLYKVPQDVREGDILFVSDGTFLIGRSAMVTKWNRKIVIQSHIKKIRVVDDSLVTPSYLFYLLNTSIVKQQVEAKTFVQATISTLGKRILDLVLPVSRNRGDILRISKEVESVIARRAETLKQINSIKSSTIEELHRRTSI